MKIQTKNIGFGAKFATKKYGIKKMKQKVQKILSGRRLSLPKQWLKDNDLKVGDWVLIYNRETYIEIVPAVVVEK